MARLDSANMQNLRHDINNQLFVIIAKCQHLQSRHPSPCVFEVTAQIKEIAFRVSEMLDSRESFAEQIAASARGTLGGKR